MNKLLENSLSLFVKEYNPKGSSTHRDDSLLREVVESLSFVRDIYENPVENRNACRLIQQYFKEYCGYSKLQGDYNNVIGSFSGELTGSILLGAHYDGPPGSPGADDNAAAIAVLIGVAERLSKLEIQPLNVVFAAFNGEEHGMLGSKDYVKKRVHSDYCKAIILEMVGYFSDEPGSQQLPMFPQYDVGDFLVIVGNESSAGLENKVDFLENTRRSVLSRCGSKENPL